LALGNNHYLSGGAAPERFNVRMRSDVRDENCTFLVYAGVFIFNPFLLILIALNDLT
jgi:hypothetical protein